MGRSLDRVDIAAAQAGDAAACAEYARHFQAVAAATTGHERVVEALAYVTQQVGRFGHEKRERVGEVVEVIFAAGAYVTQRTLYVPCIGRIGDGLDAYSLCFVQMNIVAVVEHSRQRTAYGVDFQPDTSAVGHRIKMSVEVVDCIDCGRKCLRRVGFTALCAYCDEPNYGSQCYCRSDVSGYAGHFAITVIVMLLTAIGRLRV